MIARFELAYEFQYFMNLLLHVSVGSSQAELSYIFSNLELIIEDIIDLCERPVAREIHESTTYLRELAVR